MEEFEKDWIRKSRVKLLENTNFNTLVDAHLQERDIWSDSDKATVNACMDKYEKIAKFYHIIQQRKGAYKILIEVFEQTKQCGAAEILKDGLKHHENSLRLQNQKLIFRKDLIIQAFHSGHTKLVILTCKNTRITSLKFRNDSTYKIKFIKDFHYSNQGIFRECENYAIVVEGTELQTTVDNIKSENACKIILITDQTVEEVKKLMCEWDSNNYAVLEDEIQWSNFHEDCQNELLNQLVLFQGREIRLQDIDLISRNDETSKKLLNSIQEETLIQLVEGKIPVLVEPAVPRKPTYYVERKLQSKFQSVSPDIFNDKKTKDIFLVAKITHQQFANLIKGRNREIVTSAQFIRQYVYSIDNLGRFVILESQDDFDSVCHHTKATVHLLKFSKENKCLNWMMTRGEIDLIRKYTATVEPKKQSETSCLAEIEEKRFICIADTPGMGKSNILYSFAEKITETSPTRLTLFFVLSELINENINGIENSEITHEKIVQILASKMKSKFTKAYAEIMLDSEQTNEEIKVELMFDGLDEVLVNHLDEAKGFIKNVTDKLKCARVWLTTRPHLMDTVEEEFSTLSITISPFSEDDQLDFLTRFWGFEDEFEERTKIFGKGCIQVLRKNIESKFERSMAGIPLQCMLLAEVFKERGSDFIKSDEAELNINFESITNLYERLFLVKMKIFVRKQGFENVGQFEETYIAKMLLKRMELIHMRMSVELICPEWLERFEPIFDSVADASDEEICAYGLVEHISNKSSEDTSAGVLRFLHRTIAEIFVALLQIRLGTNAYSSKQISEETRGTLCGQFIIRLHENLIAITEDLSIVKYFFDKLLSDEIITLMSRNPYTKCELKNELPYQRGARVMHFTLLLDDLISNNLLNILKLLVSSLDSDELESFISRVKTWHLPLISNAVHCGTLQMVEYLTTLFSQGNGENYIRELCLRNNPQKYKYLASVTVGLQSPIGSAISLGKYDITEYLMNHHGLAPDVWDTLREHFRKEAHIHRVLLNSNENTSNTISEKIKFIQKLSSFQGGKSVVNGNLFEITPILETNIAPELTQCLLECGANIHVNYSKHGTVLHRMSKMELLRGNDFNSMVDSYLRFGLNITALNSNLETALAFAVVNDTIRLSTNTINIFLEHFSELQMGLTLKQIFSKMTGSPDEIQKIGDVLTCAVEKDKLLKARDFDGNTVMHMLMMAKFMKNGDFGEILAILLQRGLSQEQTWQIARVSLI